jgi:hypothetical protein
MPAFETFEAATSGAAPAERATAFVTKIAARSRDYYSTEVYGSEAGLKIRAQQFFESAQSKVVFRGVPPLDSGRLFALAKSVGPAFATEQRRFMQAFADFTCNTTVEFGVSLLVFDGHPTDLGRKHYLLFGVDTIALLHPPEDMPGFFDHELFHLYHRQVMANRAPRGAEPAWWMMWREGLATYVSQRMNSELDAQQVLWYPPDIVSTMNKDLPHAAMRMLQDIDQRGSLASRWFLADESVDGLPARAGYYLGYLFAKSEGDGKALPRLARMPPDRVHADVVRFLRQLGQAPGN